MNGSGEPLNRTRHRVVSVALGVALGVGGALAGRFAVVQGDAVRSRAPEVRSAELVTVPPTVPPTVVSVPRPTTTPAPSTSRPPTTTTTTVPPPTTTSTTVPATTTTAVAAPATTAAPVNTIRVWLPYEPVGPEVGFAALTGEPADESITMRPILAVKIENERGGRPQWGMEFADAIFEENVEAATRFIVLFHSRYPDRAGPVRSARTGDLDILTPMNRPVLGWSGGNPGVTKWVESAASSGVLVNFTALRNRCYERSTERKTPHNLLIDPECAATTATAAGPARRLWEIDPEWTPAPGSAVTPDTRFTVKMDGLTTEWQWDPASGTYLRFQAGGPHLLHSGVQLAANTVVELRTFHSPSPVDGRTPHPVTIGGTTAVIHRDGVAIQATWYRENAYSRYSFYDAVTGARIPLDTGRTFVQLVRDR